jgi:hypothetical protein
MLGCARRPAELQTRRPPSIPNERRAPARTRQSGKSRNVAPKTRAAPGGNTLYPKNRLDRAPNALKTAPHSPAGEISGLSPTVASSVPGASRYVDGAIGRTRQIGSTPVGVAMLVDERLHDLDRRSSSAIAKYAEALRRILFACRSSRTSRSSVLIRSRSSLVVPAPGASGTDGAGASGRPRVAMGGDWLDRGEDRLHDGDAARLGSAG